MKLDLFEKYANPGHYQFGGEISNSRDFWQENLLPYQDKNQRPG